MGDSLEISDSSVVNGVVLDTDKQYLNSGDAEHCMFMGPSDDLLVVKKVDDSDRSNEFDMTENISEPFSLPVATSPFNNEHDELYLKIENGEDDVKSSYHNYESACLITKEDSDEGIDADNEKAEIKPLFITASPLVDNDLNIGIKNGVGDDDDDVKSSYRDCEGNDADIEENAEIMPSLITASLSVDNEQDDDDLNLKVGIGVDIYAKSISCLSKEFDPSLSSKVDNSGKRNDDIAEEKKEFLPADVAANPFVDNDQDYELNLGTGNGIDDDDEDESVIYCESSGDKCESSVTDTASETNDEHISLNQASGSDSVIVITTSDCTEIVNSDVDGGNIESESTVQYDPSSPQKPASHDAAETVSARCNTEDLPPAAVSKPSEKHCTGKSCAVEDTQLQLFCENDGTTIIAINADSGKHDDRLTCEAADESSSVYSLSQISPTAVVTSSVTLSSTVAPIVIVPLPSSNLNASVLPDKVSILSGMPPVSSSSSVDKSVEQSIKPVAGLVLSTASTTASGNTQPMSKLLQDDWQLLVSTTSSSSSVSKPVQGTSKPLAASVTSTASATASGSTRPMSKLLQDVGLLLVSQRVFKNLASIQKQKVGSSDTEGGAKLLQQLKTSHQNLVAKNRGLLTTERKCWCGYRSESMNVIEEHRITCDYQSRCCYCRGEFVYRTPRQMKQHLWKVHRKFGHVIDRNSTFGCCFCSVDFPSRMGLLRHISACRRRNWLAENLVPISDHKDIPVTAASKPLAQTPVKASLPKMSPVTASQNLPAKTSMSSATLASPVIIPPVNLQLSAPRNPGSVPQLLRIGKQLFTLFPSTTVATSAIALSHSSVKSVSRMALNSAAQTAQNRNLALPVVVNNRSLHPAIRMPNPVLQVRHQLAVCPVCSTFVKDKTTLLIHMHIAHSNTHRMCQYCCNADVSFPTLDELQTHITKFHTSDCWICKARFQPSDHLVDHVAERHKVTMFKMLELLRCYLCSSVPALTTYVAFEEHMMKQHSLQFSDPGKLWDRIMQCSNADKNWYAKKHPDGTLECPHCRGQFISSNFLYRHLHLEHDGNIVRLVKCHDCQKQMPSNILSIHRIAAHTRKCSVQLSEIDVSDSESVLIPPVGTKRLKNKMGERVSVGPPVKRGPPLKRVRTAETVVISDDGDDTGDDVEYCDDSNDEDFVMNVPINIEPKHRLHRSVQTRLDRRNSSVDDVHEVLESIVNSSELQTVADRSVSFTNASISRPSVGPAAAAQLCNGITEDEVEIIESIVPAIRDRRRQLLSRPVHVEPSNRNCPAAASAVLRNTSHVEVIGELIQPKCQNGESWEASTKPKSALVESSAQQLMEREQIMENSVEEVLEIDGETVLIVHDDDDDDDD